MSKILWGTAATYSSPMTVETYVNEEYPINDGQYVTSWAMRSSILAQNGVAYNQWSDQSMWWEWPYSNMLPGNQTRKIIRGVTRDSTGNPLGNCTVNVFLTATNAFETTVTSASDGSFSAPVGTTGQYYCVAFLAGSPDSAGATDSNLTGV